MITHCPECGDFLKRQWHTAPTLESYLCLNKSNQWVYHYEVVYKEKSLYSIYRIININDKFFLFVSNKNPIYTRIVFVNEDVAKSNDTLYYVEEFITTIDELEFTKKIIKMKAFT